MRTKKSFINMATVCVSYLVIMLGQLWVMRDLNLTLGGLGIIGLNATLTQFVSFLTVIELGLSAGITYRLYEPIKDKNWSKVATVLNFLKKSYILIAGVTLAGGLAMSLWIPNKENFTKPWLSWVFILYVLDVLASYIFCHKRAMFMADQKYYVIKIIYTCSQVTMSAAQIAVLYMFNSFEIFLICKIIFRIVETLVISALFKKHYGYINLKTKLDVPASEKKSLFRDMRALLYHKLSSATLDPSIAAIMWSSLSAVENGIYGNYMKIAVALTTVTNEIFHGMVSSFGNLLATENKERAFNNFNVLYFFNFLMYSFFSVAFFNVITPFMVWWMDGDNVTFGVWATLSITFYMYIYGMSQSTNMAKMSSGLYDPDKYLSFVGIAISIVSSWILVKHLGVTGIMLGYAIGRFSIPYWCQPYLVYDRVFHKSVKTYHLKYLLYAALTAAYVFICYFICAKFSFQNSIFQIAFNLGVCIVLPNALNILIFSRTKEFKALWNAAKGILRKKAA